MAGRNVVLFIAMSLDGYIADENQDIGFLGLVKKDGEDYGYEAFSKTTDVVILGRKTWDKLVSFNIPNPYPGKKVYVISKSKTGTEGEAGFYNGDLTELIESIRLNDGKDIHIDGGSEIVRSLLEKKLIDKLILSVIPVLLGNGIPLFRPSFVKQNLRLVNTKSFSTGLVQLHYELTNS
jgi:dihydrofolate reductase